MTKFALVTGGSRGIGRAVCVTLAEMGYNVLINYQSNEAEANKTLALVKEKGVSGEIMKFDVSKLEEVTAVLDTWIQANKDNQIEVLVNNAGIRKDNLMMWMSDTEWHSVMDIAVDGFFYVTRLVIKNMLVKKYGRVINIVSLSGLKGLPGQTNYSASKAAVIGATKALSQEVGRRGITVNAVAPGFIKTEMTQDLNEKDFKSLIPMNRFGEVQEVADVVGWLASSKSTYVTGQVISVNGGLYS
ncbi:3-oxoacyl-ACP reductase FabG [Aurantibacillus circumpalustris]|uniref:3-oxoacyl-ACP reductase FabG n=1 Tax=Aurantibacillus circumpalustris TaxID=3036359 RepID=UPI00295B6E83|nr:3-oxoacyl-ACP reductase FabG [Aurantibacillus circumpalustris]